MPEVTSTERTFAPRSIGFLIRLVLWGAGVIVMLVLMIIRLAQGVEWQLLGFLPLVIAVFLATPRVLDRVVLRVEPGVAVTRRSPLRRSERFPLGTARIVFYVDVTPDKPSTYNTSPTGPINRRWAVLFVDGRVAARLSMHQWTRDQLVELAATIPATARIVDESVPVARVRSEEPLFYTWWENHLGFYWLVFWCAILVIPVGIILAGLVAAI